MFEETKLLSIKGLFFVSILLFITVQNLKVYLSIVPTDPKTGQVLNFYHYSDVVNLPRRNQWFGYENIVPVIEEMGKGINEHWWSPEQEYTFDEANVMLPPHESTPPKLIRPNLLARVNRNDKNWVDVDDKDEWLRMASPTYPWVRRVHIGQGYSTIAEFQAVDFMMENCELNIQISSTVLSSAGESTSNQTFRFNPGSDKSTLSVSVYELETSFPLPFDSLSYSTLPPRRKETPVFQFRIERDAGDVDIKHRYHCPLETFTAFEFVTEDEEGEINWTQVRKIGDAYISMYQYPSEILTRPPSRQPQKEMENDLSWNLPELQKVLLRIIPLSKWFSLGSPVWEDLLPGLPTGHVIHLPLESNSTTSEEERGDGYQTKTVALFHQLRCIQYLHDAYVNEGWHLPITSASSPPSVLPTNSPLRHKFNPPTRTHARTAALANHCLNYLRQTILCQMDLRNEPQIDTDAEFSYNGFDNICWDWEALVETAKENGRVFMEMGFEA